MSNIFLISDCHWGHEKTCTVFKRADGSPLRPFSNAEEMNEIMIERWNNVVRPNDKVYNLGDCVINRRYMDIHSRLNGDKRLILGNHDIFDHADYLKYYKRLHGSFKLDNLWLTHIPVHIDSVPRWALANVHGHLHFNEVMRKVNNTDVVDSRYFNVSVEMIDFTPIALEDLKKKIVEKQIKYPLESINNSVIL